MPRRIWDAMREPVNGLTHLGAAVVSAIGLAALLVTGDSSVGKEVSLLIYGSTLILLFAASATYHLVKGSPRVLGILRKLDHAAIYLLIAGSYTPFCYNMFSGFWQWGLLVIVWSLALAGVIVKIFIIKSPRWLNATIYLVLGWLIVFAVREMLATLPVGALVWLLAGGALYTVGAIVYATKILNFLPGKFGFHEVWHIFVILGALAHFAAVILYVAPAS